MKHLMLIPLMFLWAQDVVTASPIIVDGPYVAEAIARNAVVWDVRPADAYAGGHIVGAINIGDAAKVLRDENTEDFIATDRIEKILGAAGLDPKRETIIYGIRGTWNPYLALYTLQYFGGRNVRVYHEGIEDWVAAGRAISRDPSQLPPVALKLEINPTVAVTTKEMVARLNNSNVQIVDARTPQNSLAKISAQFAVVIFRAQSTSLTNRIGSIPKPPPSSRASRSPAMPACRSSRPRT
jgi:thiosulfate/3-mercaptopyruvate sulfurtransferase